MNEKLKRRWYQFSLRTMFVGMTFLAIMIAGIAQIHRWRGEATKDAYRNAILEGRLPPESGRQILGDEVDQLAKRRKP